MQALFKKENTMISCTEFIPAYSELFAYLDRKKGHEEVKRFWAYLFEPDGKGIPLVNFVEREGIRGCYTYWAGTLNEEAADFSMYVNEKRGFFYNVMHHCPSKGRLLELKDEIGITPYPYYCRHCDYYRYSVEKAGLKYIYNFDGTDKAQCSMLIYDPKVFDGRIILDENTEAMHRNASDNEYFHKDFHSSMNMGVDYLGKKYGQDSVVEYLTTFTKNVYNRLIDDMKVRGLRALEEKILDTYRKEKEPEAVKTELSENGKELTVNVIYCPGVTHLRKTGREVSNKYRYTTETVMATLAESVGAEFTMGEYDEETGRTSYSFAIK